MADKITSFSSVFDTFLSKITDDMYMELSEEETLPLQEELLMSALPHFEFPRKDIFNFDKENQVFNVDLSFFGVIALRRACGRKRLARGVLRRAVQKQRRTGNRGQSAR